ncbi:hypothetical protein ABWK22_01020 [Gottfriedia acidiceleris]|uniref:hypothetical protein n=1 Tax=Bacillaceae TaxID=186817 RepID=UPI001596E86F|nr:MULTISPECIES: hypothetical protein [unclassified Bacillus (in: firmicutes)]
MAKLNAVEKLKKELGKTREAIDIAKTILEKKHDPQLAEQLKKLIKEHNEIVTQLKSIH